jgi:hypothetical protein
MDGCTITGLAFIVIQATVHCPQPAVPVARLCQSTSTIRYSSQDTAETRRQLRRHNAAYRAVCQSGR